jgi:hypothetical protein
VAPEERQGATDEKPKKRDWTSVGVSIAALFVSIFSVLLSWYWNSPIGDVSALEPSGYAIVRGIDPTFEGEPGPREGLGVGPYPSDHVVMPLEWANNSGSSILVKDPVLVFDPLGRDGPPAGDEIEFFLVGEFPEMSAQVFNGVNTKPHTFKNSLVIEPHTVIQSISVFRIEGWFEEPNQCFRFIPGQRYRVEIRYLRIPEDPKVSAWWRLTGLRSERERTLTLVEQMTIQTTVDYLNVYGPTKEGESIGWDFYSLLPGSRSLQGDTPPRADADDRYSEEYPCT